MSARVSYCLVYLDLSFSILLKRYISLTLCLVVTTTYLFVILCWISVVINTFPVLNQCV